MSKVFKLVDSDSNDTKYHGFLFLDSLGLPNKEDISILQ